MNTPKPCDTCPLLYWNVLTEDEPNAESSECKFGRTLGNMACPYKGTDNHGVPKADYITKLMAMSDGELFKAMKDKIWLSAYAASNLRSDYHWQCDATHDEGQRRDKPYLYSRAHAEVTREAG